MSKSYRDAIDSVQYKCNECNKAFLEYEFVYKYNNNNKNNLLVCKDCNAGLEEKEKYDEEYAFYNDRIVLNEIIEKNEIRIKSYDELFEEFESVCSDSYYSKNILNEIKNRFIMDIADGKFEGNYKKMMEIAKKIK